MKSSLAILILALIALSAFASDGWESASNTREESTGDPMLTRCFYRTLGGYEFSIVHRGLCPFTVKVNPETGEVKK